MMTETNTDAISDTRRKAERSKVSIPTERGVEEAKDWVEHNAK